MPNLLEAVKQYATEHYESDGWDVLVECYEDSEILSAIGTATTLEVALRNVQRNLVLREYDSVRKDVQGEIW